MMFSTKVTDALRNCEHGIDIKYRSNCRLFHLRGLQAGTKANQTVVNGGLFADDCTDRDEMHQQMDKFSSTCDNFGLTISTKKTEVFFQPA